MKTILNKTVAVAMSLLSVIVFLIILLVTTVKADTQSQQIQPSNVQNFKDLVTNMIKEQSNKIQTLFKKIQTNAQTMLQTLKSIKQNSISSDLKNKNKKDTTEVESTLEKSINLKDSDINMGRSFKNLYTTTGYGDSGHGSSGHGHTGHGHTGHGHAGHGLTGNANFALASTYHHHSIGFDPINIVVSVSLLSFLLQAIQGLLSRTRTPTPVVEARSMDFVQDWLTAYRENSLKANILKLSKYPKKNFFKKYIR